MTKDEIVTHLAETAQVNKSEATRVLNSLTDLIVVELRSGRDFQFRDVGTLKIKRMDPRTARNPATGERLDVPARNYVKIKIAQTLFDALNP